jgi:hypothetical protein
LGWGTGETVRLECGTNGGTSWSPIATATNLACGARLFWWDTLSVPNGTGYSFRVVSESTPTLVSAPDGSYQIDNNRYAPALAWTGDPGFETNGVEPDLGLDVTNFVFEVTYSDGDNHAPASGFPRLRIMKGSAEIAGSPFAMTEVSVAETNHAAGKRYKSAALTLAAGSDYTYGFEAQDTHAAPAASADPVSAHSGPVVTKTARLRVASTYGGITLPLGTNVCVAGSLIACSVTNSPVTMGLTQYVCTGWAGTGSVTNGAATNAVFTLNEDGGVTWLWQTNYSLAVTTNGQGTADPAQVWVPSGSTTTVTATAAAHWHLDRWGGDIDGCIISSNRIVVVADRPRAMTALFAIDQHTFTMISPYAGMRTRTSPEFRMTIGFPGYNKDETLTNFPALVVLSTNIPGFNYAEVASTNGGNLLFRDATGLLELNYEIEKWNTNGSSYIWVQLPTLASSNDFIELSWLKNGPALRGGLTAKATWEDGFSGVWHLSESPTNAAPQMRDSTAMTNHASCRSMIDSDQTAGRIGGAVSLNGNSKYMDCGNALSLQNSAGTMEAWIMTSANDTTYRAIVCKQSAYGMFVRNRKLLVYDWGNNATRDTGAVVADGTWHHVAFSYRNNVTNGTSVYVDGSKKLDCLVKIDGQTTGEFIGYGNSPNQYHSGLIDEVRASAVYRSGNWLWATWMNAASNSQFNSYGEVQTPYAMTDGTVTFVATNFAYGTELTCAITNSPVSGQGTQYVGTGWILAGVSDTHGSSSGEGTNMTLLLTNNTILTWQWQTNFWLAASNSGPGWVAATNGWLPYGFHTNAVAVPSNYYHFVLWTGTVNSASNPLPLTMDQAHNLAALFAENVATQGTPEWWLAHYGWTSDFNAAATNDADHDGLLNWQEWVAGTDPTNPASALRVLSLTSATNGMRIGWQGGTSVWQYLERSTGLGSGLPWTVIFSNGPVAAASTNFLDTATTNTPSFYRIKAVR